MIDCTAPPIIAVFGDSARCQLVTTCQTRMSQVGIPIPPDIKATCDKALADWKIDEAAHAAATVKPQDDMIRSLMKK